MLLPRRCPNCSAESQIQLDPPSADPGFGLPVSERDYTCACGSVKLKVTDFGNLDRIKLIPEKAFNSVIRAERSRIQFERKLEIFKAVRKRSLQFNASVISSEVRLEYLRFDRKQLLHLKPELEKILPNIWTSKEFRLAISIQVNNPFVDLVSLSRKILRSYVRTGLIKVSGMAGYPRRTTNFYSFK